MEYQLWFIPLGFALGVLGTLIGVGGGFILVPVMLLLYPHQNPEVITSISLTVVFFNALSGSWAYARMSRIDYRSGMLFAAATVPGAILGALTTDLIPRRLFNGIFGFLMAIAAVYLLFNKTSGKAPRINKGGCLIVRTVTPKSGNAYTFSYDLRIGIILSLLIGYLSSMLGIGGGIIHVPVLIRLLDFPVHIATATSHFILVFTALTGSLVHILKGSFTVASFYNTILLSVGVLVGAQLGAVISTHVHGRWIIRGLAIALAFAGIRIMLMALKM
jgi:uncharacterized protein